jgi:hypothetical protein
MSFRIQAVYAMRTLRFCVTADTEQAALAKAREVANRALNLSVI